MRMTSIADWRRPSTWLLLMVLSGNLLLPMLYLWPANAAMSDVPLRDVPAIEPRLTAAARVQPVSLQLPPKRPAPARALASRAESGSATPACRAWGPFDAATEAEALAAALALPPEGFHVLESQLEADPEYLVTLRVPGPRAAAESLIAELAAREVESYLLERNAEGSVLALGVFSVERRAHSQQRRVAEMGYDAAVHPLERASRTYHLLARIPDDHPVESAALGAGRACGDIAPGNQFL